MLRGISLQIKLALYQLCHVLISCLISESPNAVINPRISGLKHLSRRTDNPSQPINRSFSLSGLSTPPMCQREDTIGYRLTPGRNLGQNEVSGLENEESCQECAPRRNHSQSGTNAQTQRSRRRGRRSFQHGFSTKVQTP